MAGAGDRARFYLERSVPELQELARKKIFTKAEISTIAKKRLDFEHVINARGSQPSDYVRYIAYEQNVEWLRRKRTKRLGVKAAGYNGQKRIFFLLERATRKFHGDIRLWMQYLDYAQTEKAYKRVGKILSSALRLHPTKPELWLVAAKYAADSQEDIGAARGYMQRALRFCPREAALWIEYAKLEMIYIGKTMDRLRVLGLKDTTPQQDEDHGHDLPDADVISLPLLTSEDMNPGLESTGHDESDDEAAIRNMAATPALTGAIPMAIFDAATKQLDGQTQLVVDFFDMFANFQRLPCCDKILRHVLDFLTTAGPHSPSRTYCAFRLPLISLDTDSVEFPAALGEGLRAVRETLKQVQSHERAQTAERIIPLLLPLAVDNELDADIKTVVVSSITMLVKVLNQGDAVAVIAEKLQQDGQDADQSKFLLEIGIKQYGGNELLLQSHALLISNAKSNHPI